MKQNINKTIRFGLAALAGLCLLAVQAKAITEVNMGTNGVGIFNPWLNPSTVDNSYLANMITVYNGGVPTPDFETYIKMQGDLTPNKPLPPSPGLGGNVSVLNSPLTFDIDLGPTGAGDYLVAGWDGPNGVHAVYWIKGLTGVIELENDVPDFQKYGLSNYWLSGETPPTVPDGGSTMALLGFALVGVESVRRRFAKA